MKIELDKEQKSIIELVAQYPDSLSSQRRFDSIIADCIPENKALRNALSIAYEEDVINILHAGTDSQQTMYRCRKLLENNGGLRAELAISAILVMAYICGKQEWFQNEPQAQRKELSLTNQKPIIKRYNCGQLEYVEVEDGVVLTKVDFLYNGLRPSKTAIAIPEKVNEISVIGVMPNAFNSVRKSRCKIILLPQTVTTVGRQDTKLYESFHEKGVFTKPIIYLAKTSYCKYEKAYDFYRILTAFDQEDFFGFETTLDDMETYGFIPLKRYQDENEYWRYPEDELWVCEGQLDRYSGMEEKLQINGLRSIGADAFVNLPIKERAVSETLSPKFQPFFEQLFYRPPPVSLEKCGGFFKFMLDIRASLCGAPDYESVLKVVRRALVSRYDFSFYFTRRSHLCSNNGNPISNTSKPCATSRFSLTLPVAFVGDP